MNSAGSKTATEISEEFPNVCFKCTFLANTAAVSGGVIESAAGKDRFLNITFKGNSGAIGGGLRLAGTAILERCDFLGNGGNEAGPTVANIGAILVVNSTFTNNGLLCASATFCMYTVQASGVVTRSEPKL